MHHRVVPIFWWLAGGTFGRTYLRQRKVLNKQERMSRTEMDAFQWRRLQQLLAHAYEHVPFYRSRFDALRLHPTMIRTPADFQKLPILTRRELQDHLETLVATNFDRSMLLRSETGGSTGDPVAFYDYEANRALQKAVIQRARAWAGFEEGQKIAIIWGADRDLPTWSWLERQKVHRILRQRWLNSYRFTDDSMATFAEELLRWKPRYILGYAASVYIFACFLKDNDIVGIRPAAIETSAEKLWDYQRKLIEEVFGCGVFDSYGSRDVSGIAFECERHEGLHVFSDNVYLELLNDGDPAEAETEGEVIVTKLTNYAMPLIRYRNGDIARARSQACSCGRPFPLLAEVVGRSNDVIATPRGAFVHGAFFNHLLFDVDGIRQFQVHQKSLTDVHVSLCGTKDIPAEILARLQATIERQLGFGVKVQITSVKSIAPTPTGKHRYIVSEVGKQFANRVDDRTS